MAGAERAASGHVMRAQTHIRASFWTWPSDLTMSRDHAFDFQVHFLNPFFRARFGRKYISKFRHFGNTLTRPSLIREFGRSVFVFRVAILSSMSLPIAGRVNSGDHCACARFVPFRRLLFRAAGRVHSGVPCLIPDPPPMVSGPVIWWWVSLPDPPCFSSNIGILTDEIAMGPTLHKGSHECK